MLKRLDAAGLVSGRHIEQADRPDKRLFRITEAGMVALRSWLAVVEPIEPEDNDPLLLKLFFGGFGDPESSRRQLLDYRGRVEERLAAYLEIERTFDDEPDVAALHRLLTVRMGIAIMQANRAWVGRRPRRARRRRSGAAARPDVESVSGFTERLGSAGRRRLSVCVRTTSRPGTEETC